jgi:ribose transport system substrate-binding protein
MGRVDWLRRPPILTVQKLASIKFREEVLSISRIAKSLLVSAAFSLATVAAHAEGIGASLLTQQHPFYNELAKAMTAEAKAKNVKLEVSIANQDLNKQLADIEDFIVKGVDVIVMSPVDSKGALAAVMRAQAAGIKVITVDVPVEGAQVASYIGTDNYAGGVKAGELMAEQLGNKGNVAIIDYPLVQSVVNRVNGFKEAIAKHPEMKIVSIQTGITRAEALAVAQNMLQANPDIAGIFGFGDDAALAAAVAVKSAGLTGKVKVIGFDGMPEALGAVDRDPDMVGVIQQFPDQMGKLAVDTAIKIAAGETVPAEQPIVPGVYTKK